MKEIKAMIRPEKFEDVYRELRSKGYCCLTVYHGEGIGRRGDPDKLNASLEFPFLHSKVVKIEIVVADEDEDEVVGIIQQKACTHHQGDGIIFSSTIDKAISIRTGEEGEAAV
jgi:nitrogen regulatory protein PII